MNNALLQEAQHWITEHHDEIIGWRRHIHKYPELSHKEFATTDFIEEILKHNGLHPVRFTPTGLYVDIGPEDKPRVAFRADIDALPINEQSAEPFSSVKPGVMHACGHDIHTTIALALACFLAQTTQLETGVRIIFQPAEEVMDGGAPEVIAQGALRNVAAIFAVHAEPKIAVGQVGVREGAITSAGDVVEITVKGAGGHSARPHLTTDVVYALAKLVTELPGLLSRRVDPRSATVMVFGTINAGYAPNAIPEHGSVAGTIRTGDIDVWREMEPLLRQLIDQVLAPTGCEYDIVYTKGVPPVVNDDCATSLLRQAARALDPASVITVAQSTGGEDFSWYLEHVPGSMARLGCWDTIGEVGDLHQADMRADEGSLAVGIRLFAAVLDQYQMRGHVHSDDRR
ncbi:amidohydrolase [Corynebacterium sp. sy039]|uniref:amidohydrolase n=1 Tax=Corynebacterium sp. sy039 TaxID=2599641 RepID=UPI0011B6DE5E|nr:amidohydrolase [Corynebacterium sp. sy039]QDZ42097.1 amidohydrolase [Corynebacterium sp. sy039]